MQVTQPGFRVRQVRLITTLLEERQYSREDLAAAYRLRWHAELDLRSIKQVGNKVTLVGYAQSNARVSTLMRNVEASPWLGQPELVEIKLVTPPATRGPPTRSGAGPERLNEFTMNLQVKRTMPPAGRRPRPWPRWSSAMTRYCSTRAG